MSYIIDSGIWSSVFAVPSCIVDEHIKMCSPLSLKILLVMLRHPGVPVDAVWLSEQLNISSTDISDAVNYWIGAGIISDSAQPVIHTEHKPAQTAPVSTVSAPAPAVREKTSQTTGQRIVTISSRPKISREDIAAMANSDPSIAMLLSEAQGVVGAPLTPVESEILTSLCSYYGMQSDVVLMLLSYCVSIGQKNMHYVEKLAASWMERGINTHERVELEIMRLTKNNENEQKIVKAFGIFNRALTSKERDYTARWYELGLDENLIFLACERTVENIGKVSFAYADKILTSWKAKGISTVKAAVDDLGAGKRPEPKQNKSAQTGGDSSLDMDKLHELLHQQFRD